MSESRSHDIFITHAWRFHEDWKQAARMLDDFAGFRWRNFSLPWHDPAIDPNSAQGGRTIRDSLEDQIVPVHSVILLSGVYAVKSARRWLDLEVQLARRHDKRIVALPALGESTVPEDIRAMCDGCSTWSSAALVAALGNSQDAAR